MDEDFARAKSYIIEGLEALVTFYSPFVRMIQGFKTLMPDGKVFGDEDIMKAMELYEQMDLVLKSWLSDIRAVGSAEELREVSEKNGEFMLRFLGH